MCDVIFFYMQNGMLELQNVFWIVPMCNMPKCEAV